MVRIGASNEYFYQHNMGDAVFEIVTDITFVDEIDVEAMQRAATDAISLYPELGFMPVLKDDSIVPAENDAPVVFCEYGSCPLCFGSDETNGYLFYVMYTERRLMMRFFHGMADYVGLKAYIKTMLYFYLTGKGIEIKDENFLRSCRIQPEDLVGLDEDDMYDPYRKYGDMTASSPLSMPPGTFQFSDIPDKLPYNNSHLYEVVLSTSEFLKKTKELGISFAPLLHLVVCDAICASCDVGEAPYVGMLPVDLRRFFDSKTLVNCSDSVFIPQTFEDRKADIAIRGAKIKKYITDSMNAEYARALMGDKVRQVEDYDKLKKALLRSRPSASENKDENPSKKVTAVRPFTFGVTYPGATVWEGGIDEYVENVRAYGLVRISMVSISTYKDVMQFTFNMKTEDTGLIGAVGDVLGRMGISSKIVDHGLIEKTLMPKDRLKK
ncbi:MAG: hypothetical protein IJM23_08690 [Lachnospiraceae bacterium]|nr:hypothetical protein [Lachnospiraceae bacterium]